MQIPEPPRKRLKKSVHNLIAPKSMPPAKHKEHKELRKVAQNEKHIVDSSEFVGKNSDMVERIKKKPVIWEPFTTPNEWHPKGPQIEFLESTEDEVLFSGGRGPLAYGEKVLTPTGFVNIEDVQIGDIVTCPDNTTTIVTDIPFDGEDDCYEFEFVDGRKVTSGVDHKWRARVPSHSKKYTKWNELTTAEIIEFHNAGYNVIFPLSQPLDYEYDNYPLVLDPYFLGLMLGDGHINTHISITSHDPEIIDYCKSMLPLKHITEYLDGKELRFHSKSGFRDKFRELGLEGCLSATKFVPEQYLKSSKEVRLAVLQGLLDTDGHTYSRGYIEFTTVSEKLAGNVQELVWSLGGKATCNTKVGQYKDKNGDTVICQLVYRLYIRLRGIKPFRLTRKLNSYLEGAKLNKKVDTLRIKNITYKGYLKCKCITVAHPDHEFITTHCIITKNSGKSDCLMVDPLRYCGNKNFRGLMLRRTMPELRELISRAKDLYPKVYPGTKWREQEKMFTFPSGARMEFGYCDTIDDAERYRGQQYTWLGIDEISQFPSEEFYTKIAASIRTVDPSLPVYKRFTTNPNGAGRGWVKRRWIDVSPPGERKEVEYQTSIGNFKVSRKWIQSTVKDNPKLNTSPGYMAMLASLPEALRAAWLYGEWGTAEGLAFPDFNPKTHVVQPFDIPKNWYRFRACDWGFQSLAVCLWFAIDPDNNIYVYREFATRLKTADVFARMVLHLEYGENIKYGVIDGSVGDNRGTTGPTIDEQMRNEGLRWRYADKSAGSRKAGKMMVHKYLQIQSETDKPKLFIFNNCKELIEELDSLPVDDNDPEDVDTDQKDHAYDALRYGVSSRPDFANYSNMWNSFRDDAPVIVDPIFGC